MMAADDSKPVRMESDSMGEVAVPADRLWGAQTQRALRHFDIGSDRMPAEVIRALAMIKKAEARTNLELGLIEKHRIFMANSPDKIMASIAEVSKWTKLSSLTY